MGDVVNLHVQTTVDIPAEKVLNAALAAGLEQVIIIGVGPDGPYHASTTADIPEQIFRMEMFKRDLLNRAAE